MEIETRNIVSNISKSLNNTSKIDLTQIANAMKPNDLKKSLKSTIPE